MTGGTVDILIVEDNDSERESIEEALRRVHPHIRIASVRDGKTALDFIFCSGPYTHRTHAQIPRLVLLDLYLPGTTGYDVLKALRTRRETQWLPVVVFSDSCKPGDVVRSYRYGANSYISKPVGFDDFAEAVEEIGRYWLAHNRVAV